jgi:Protein of unknown function (DUF1343)
VNHHPLPVRHGMTIGELAELFNADDHMGVRLQIVRARGWRRGDYLDATGLPWVNPSPNLRSVDEALLYPGVGLLEGSNVSVGRGASTPFEVVGAPWMNGPALTRSLGAMSLPGVSFAATTFTPATSVYAGEVCQGVRVTITGRAQFEPVRTGVDVAAGALVPGAGYRGGALQERDLWAIAEDHDVDTDARAAALRMLTRPLAVHSGRTTNARAKADAILASVHDDGERRRMRVALAPDLEEAAREIDLLDDRATAKKTLG